MNSSDFITGPPLESTVAEHTLYARDANGEVMAIYKGSNTEANRYNMTCSEWYIYGSKSHGRFARSQEPPYNTTMPIYDPALLYNAGSPPIHTRRLKYKDYEIKDHLGNVTTLFSDLKLPTGTLGTYFKIDLMEANNFYPFGMSETGLHYTAPSFNYRYSYNGMEKDDAIKGEGNSYDYGARFFDPRLGRFLSLDAAQDIFPGWSPYNSSINNPILFMDPDGNLIRNKATTERDKNRINTALEKVKARNPIVYSWMEKLRFHKQTNTYLIDNTTRLYDSAEDIFFDIYSENIDREEYLLEASKSMNNSAFSWKNHEQEFGYIDIPSNLSNIFPIKNGEIDMVDYKLDINDDDKVINTLTSFLNDNKLPIYYKKGEEYLFKITVDDYIEGYPNLKRDEPFRLGAVISHEVGHSIGWIIDPIRTWFFQQKYEGGQPGGHQHENPGGKEADKQENIYNENSEGK